ncbi:alpha-tocopherol transfer protein-like [Cydia splendana]|uniref:alpha-tocopherol transfer protein-like n=1 Tax=Cydia splendana TaxID=1100963 RepID=UPI002146169B
MGEPKDLDKLLIELKEWVAAQPHVPKDMDDKLLRRFLHSCYYDMEKAQKAIESFTSLRASTPELFVKRDPMSPQVQNALKIVNLGQVKAPGNRNLFIWQLNDPGLENYDYLQDARMFFLSTDAWLLEEENLEEHDIAILDVKDITLKILTKINLSLAKKLSKYQEEAMPIRLKQVHVVNAPPFIDKVFSIMKQFMNRDMSEMIHFHVPKSDTLFKYFSRDELPKDFGGNLESLEYYNNRLHNVLLKHREILSKDDLWRAPEKKSKKSKGSKKELVADVPEVDSFRSLAID